MSFTASSAGVPAKRSSRIVVAKSFTTHLDFTFEGMPRSAFSVSTQRTSKILTPLATATRSGTFTYTRMPSRFLISFFRAAATSLLSSFPPVLSSMYILQSSSVLSATRMSAMLSLAHSSLICTSIHFTKCLHTCSGNP